MKKFFLSLMVAFYIIAGINHFVHTAYYEQIMPPWLPFSLPFVYISGICEIVFGLSLIPSVTRRVGAWLIIALLIAVFPANIQMTLNYLHRHDPQLWITILRLPIQILLVWWAYRYTGRLSE
jgi:uncharacterized membrane protein